MPKYPTSDGKMIDKKAIDRKVAQAKQNYIQSFFDEHGYHFCERTKRSDLPLDCSHIISVRMCQATGRSELAWDEQNIELLNRDAHMKIERWSNDKRGFMQEKTKELLKNFYSLKINHNE